MEDNAWEVGLLKTSYPPYDERVTGKLCATLFSCIEELTIFVWSVIVIKKLFRIFYSVNK